MEEVVHNVRENWTEEEWNDYYQTLAEAEEELDEELAL
jgi:hypothetical protein